MALKTQVVVACLWKVLQNAPFNNARGSLPKKGAGATLVRLLHEGQSIKVNGLPNTEVLHRTGVHT